MATTLLFLLFCTQTGALLGVATAPPGDRAIIAFLLGLSGFVGGLVLATIFWALHTLFSLIV